MCLYCTGRFKPNEGESHNAGDILVKQEGGGYLRLLSEELVQGPLAPEVLVWLEKAGETSKTSLVANNLGRHLVKQYVPNNLYLFMYLTDYQYEIVAGEPISLSIAEISRQGLEKVVLCVSKAEQNQDDPIRIEEGDMKHAIKMFSVQEGEKGEIIRCRTCKYSILYCKGPF